MIALAYLTKEKQMNKIIMERDNLLSDANKKDVTAFKKRVKIHINNCGRLRANAISQQDIKTILFYEREINYWEYKLYLMGEELSLDIPVMVGTFNNCLNDLIKEGLSKMFGRPISKNSAEIINMRGRGVKRINKQIPFNRGLKLAS